MNLTAREAAWWLATVPGLGAVRLRQLTELLGSPQEIWKLVEAEKEDTALKEGKWEKTGFYEMLFEKMRICQEASGEHIRLTGKNLQQLFLHRREAGKAVEEYHRWTGNRIRFITVGDNEYPERLLSLYDRPFALYVRGGLPKEDRKTAAIIGARACSAYGSGQGRKIGRELAEAGVQIISGLAYGVDSAGHRGALDAHRPAATFAVLGCGPDRCYPSEHWQLAEQIVENGGGLLSEFPPGTGALAAHFPMRNRIISGLADCILVMEARKRSGSLITVDQALEQGKEVFALPGRIDDPLSEGCHHLLASGAAVLSGSRAVLDFLIPDREKKPLKKDELTVFEKNALAPVKNMVYSCLDYQGKTIEEMMALTGLPLLVIQRKLLELLMAGQVIETAKGYYARLSQ